MDKKTLLLIALVAVGVVLYTRRAGASSAPTYTTPGAPTGTALPPRAQAIAAQQESRTYAGLGSLIGGIYAKVSNGLSSNSGGPSYGAPTMLPPDDALAQNPPASIDPYAAENAVWSGAPGVAY